MPTGITTNVNCGLGKSKSKGQPGNLAHNRREFDPYNTDPDLAVNNIFFANRSLEETYQTAFGDSIDEYISTQSVRIEFHIPVTIISNICSELIRIQ